MNKYDNQCTNSQNLPNIEMLNYGVSLINKKLYKKTKLLGVNTDL